MKVSKTTPDVGAKPTATSKRLELEEEKISKSKNHQYAGAMPSRRVAGMSPRVRGPEAARAFELVKSVPCRQPAGEGKG